MQLTQGQIERLYAEAVAEEQNYIQDVWEKPLVDGFVLSTSMLYLPVVYRASALASMEMLRRAAGYRCREYVVPDDLNNTVAAFNQVEQQVNTVRGAYLWGLTFSAPFNDSGTGNDEQFIHIQITDACTETPLFSDYVLGTQFKAVAPANGKWNQRNPCIMSTPRLVGAPGLLDVEIYNHSSAAIKCQLVLQMAEPALPPEQLDEFLRKLGLE